MAAAVKDDMMIDQMRNLKKWTDSRSEAWVTPLKGKLQAEPPPKKQVIARKLEDLQIGREVDLMACEWAERGKESERSNRLTGGVMRCRLEQRHPVSCCSNHFTAFESSLDLGEIALWNQFLPSWNVRGMSNVCYFPRAFYTPWKTNASVDLKESSVAIQHHEESNVHLPTPPNANLRPWFNVSTPPP